jgi:nitrogen fixation protein FixH
MVRREEVVIVHIFRRSLENLQVAKPAEESPKGDVEFAVGKPGDMSMQAEMKEQLWM